MLCRETRGTLDANKKICQGTGARQVKFQHLNQAGKAEVFKLYSNGKNNLLPVKQMFITVSITPY